MLFNAVTGVLESFTTGVAAEVKFRGLSSIFGSGLGAEPTIGGPSFDDKKPVVWNAVIPKAVPTGTYQRGNQPWADRIVEVAQQRKQSI
jgi:hypothetical protein